MGDYAKGIANINIRMGDEELLKPLIDVPRMAEKRCGYASSRPDRLCQRGY